VRYLGHQLNDAVCCARTDQFQWRFVACCARKLFATGNLPTAPSATHHHHSRHLAAAHRVTLFFNTDPATIGCDITAQAAEAGCDIIWGPRGAAYFIYLECTSWGNGRNHRPHMPGSARQSSWGWHWDGTDVCAATGSCWHIQSLTGTVRHQHVSTVSAVSIDKSAPA
jgi:hypothetical protein